MYIYTHVCVCVSNIARFRCFTWEKCTTYNTHIRTKSRIVALLRTHIEPARMLCVKENLLQRVPRPLNISFMLGAFDFFLDDGTTREPPRDCAAAAAAVGC